MKFFIILKLMFFMYYDSKKELNDYSYLNVSCLGLDNYFVID